VWELLREAAVGADGAWSRPLLADRGGRDR